MAVTDYLEDGTPITNIHATASDAFSTITGATFTMPDYNYADNANTKFQKGGLIGTNWGPLNTTNFKYNGSNIPFARKNSTPLPYIYDITGSGDYRRRFTTGDLVTTNDRIVSGTYVYFYEMDKTSFSNGQIAYNSTTNILTFSVNGTAVKTIACQPYIMVDVQAWGGDGGGSDHAVFSNGGYKLVRLIGGGGGGSGSFVSFASKLNSAISIQYNSSPRELRIYSGTNSSTWTLTVPCGLNGGTAYASTQPSTSSDPMPGCLYGFPGTGGGSPQWQYPPSGQKDDAEAGSSHDNIYVAYVTTGVQGSNGTGGTYHYGSNDHANTGQNGNTASSTLQTSFKALPFTNAADLSLYTITTGGKGEQLSNLGTEAPWTLLCGGGGGGNSLMANGGGWFSSHDSRPGTGAGGCGASAWKQSNAGHEDGFPGGHGGIWIYYIPI